MTFLTSACLDLNIELIFTKIYLLILLEIDVIVFLGCFNFSFSRFFFRIFEVHDGFQWLKKALDLFLNKLPGSIMVAYRFGGSKKCRSHKNTTR